jgi:hypothetical protein
VVGVVGVVCVLAEEEEEEEEEKNNLIYGMRIHKR